MRDGSRHIPAARWVIGFGRIYWGLAVFAAAASLLAVLFTGAWTGLVVPLLLAGYATAWGALVRAFTRRRPGAWRLLVAITAIDLLSAVIGWLAGRPVSALTLLASAVHAVFLGLLLHRDSRDWVAAAEPRGAVGTGTGDHPGGRH